MIYWERASDSIVTGTDWQFHNEGRVNGIGPVVATVGRMVLKDSAAGSDGRIIVTRINGKTIDEDWSSDWHSPQSFLKKERMVEKELVRRGQQ